MTTHRVSFNPSGITIMLPHPFFVSFMLHLPVLCWLTGDAPLFITWIGATAPIQVMKRATGRLRVMPQVAAPPISLTTAHVYIWQPCKSRLPSLFTGYGIARTRKNCAGTYKLMKSVVLTANCRFLAYVTESDDQRLVHKFNCILRMKNVHTCKDSL